MSNYIKVTLSEGDLTNPAELSINFDCLEDEEKARLKIKQFVRAHKGQFFTKVITERKEQAQKMQKEKKPESIVADKNGKIPKTKRKK